MDIITGSRGHVQAKSQYFRWAQQFFASHADWGKSAIFPRPILLGK
jgi:hypothetical protein